MKKVIDILYSEYGNKRKYKLENARITHNRNALKKFLTKNERKLLLRIIDDKDLIIDKTSTDSFHSGAIVGARLMIELLYDNK